MATRETAAPCPAHVGRVGVVFFEPRTLVPTSARVFAAPGSHHEWRARVWDGALSSLCVAGRVCGHCGAANAAKIVDYCSVCGERVVAASPANPKSMQFRDGRGTNVNSVQLSSPGAKTSAGPLSMSSEHEVHGLRKKRESARTRCSFGSTLFFAAGAHGVCAVQRARRARAPQGPV